MIREISSELEFDQLPKKKRLCLLITSAKLNRLGLLGEGLLRSLFNDSQISVFVINVANVPSLASKYDLKNFPVFLVLEDGEVVERLMAVDNDYNPTEVVPHRRPMADEDEEELNLFDLF